MDAAKIYVLCVWLVRAFTLERIRREEWPTGSEETNSGETEGQDWLQVPNMANPHQSDVEDPQTRPRRVQFRRFRGIISRGQLDPLVHLELNEFGKKEIRIYEFPENFIIKDSVHVRVRILSRAIRCLSDAGMLAGCAEKDAGAALYRSEVLELFTQLYVACAIKKLYFSDLVVLLTLTIRYPGNVWTAINERRNRGAEAPRKRGCGLLCLPHSASLHLLLEHTPLKQLFPSEDLYTALNHVTALTIGIEVDYYKLKMGTFDKDLRFLPAVILKACYPGMFNEAFLFTYQNFTVYRFAPFMPVDTGAQLMRMLIACAKMQQCLGELLRNFDNEGVSYRGS